MEEVSEELAVVEIGSGWNCLEARVRIARRGNAI